MKTVQKLEFQTGSREELLPDFESAFPYIASNAQLDQYAGRSVPWHWHKAVELFYMESGALEYYTPKRKVFFPAGSGGFVNANVLHMTKAMSRTEKNIQRLHIFDPALVSGISGGRIHRKYVFPITSNPQIDIFVFHPEDSGQADILRLLKAAFALSENGFGYEIKLREALSEIWLKLFELLSPSFGGKENYDRNDERLKHMLIYIHEHLSEKIAVSELAAVACLSERESFRLFSSYLHTTPAKYIQSCRLQEACRMLINSQNTIADIGYACGLGDSSYFGKLFREYQNCTPGEYRRKWQDNHILCPK
ncbi:MAG: helix-turn-helix transcriptional regulator [Lachnospiraceae bacterium]|jgi:AraC-like DNA-binding protein|nr:helix-turn-helix domain-containing protein [uncultured Acetatifactor sp.]MCI9219154.1 helix-turn-helix transcriptional regulator [Lachnospiraceae bacterium]